MSILAEICHKKKEWVEFKKSQLSFDEIKKRCFDLPPCLGFEEQLRGKAKNKEIGLIAEIKKGSPSKGIIREEFNPVEHAKSYKQAGATCLSVLTDKPYFFGSDNDFAMVRKETSLPMIRKDFMVDPYQIYESRLLGADCILLIMAALSDAQAQSLSFSAKECGLDILIECHDAQEVERALKLPSKLIGINNRNLKTFNVDISTTIDLKENIPDEYLIVSESGLSSYEDLSSLINENIYCFLIGEAMMRTDNLYQSTQEMLGIYA